jgi:hypothetical protein
MAFPHQRDSRRGDRRQLFFLGDPIFRSISAGSFGPFVMSVGVIPAGRVSDYGSRQRALRHTRRRPTFLGIGMVSYVFSCFAALQIPATLFSPVTNEAFNNVFGQSMIIAGRSRRSP